MREYGNYKLFTSIEEIRELQTVKHLTSDEVRISNAAYGYTKGHILAMYNIKKQKWNLSYFETEKECVDFVESTKQMYDEFPEVFGNYDEVIGDKIIYCARENYRVKWVLKAIVIEK